MLLWLRLPLMLVMIVAAGPMMLLLLVSNMSDNDDAGNDATGEDSGHAGSTDVGGCASEVGR
eukprot:10003238-Alexandrium_andersonii.AAC.1